MFLETVHINGKLTHMDTFDCCPLEVEAVPTKGAYTNGSSWVVVNKQEGKTPMRMEACISDCKSEAEVARRYLRSRLDEIVSDKKKAAQLRFNLDAVKAKSPAELVNWIKDGKFTFNSQWVDENGEWRESDSFLRPLDVIEFRQAPKDQKGYNAWKSKMESARQAVEDEIRILPQEQGLESLRKFEALEIQ